MSWDDCTVVEQIPEDLSGIWVFSGTRVPVAALFENLKDSATVDEFVEWFPGVGRSRERTILRHEAADATILPRS
jgi:uncharacterized protein (DUF433 family)